MNRVYRFDAPLREEADGGAYVAVPLDIRKEFGKGRVNVHAKFNGVPYDGSIVNMGVKDESGNICYILGVLKSIRKRLGIANGDPVHVQFSIRQEEKQLQENGKPATVDDYIMRQGEVAQPKLNEIRAILRAALPDAEERISWAMPTYWQGRNIIHFAASKNHLGLYPGGEATDVFARELKGCSVSKGTIRFPYEQELPRELIGRIARWCLEKYGK